MILRKINIPYHLMNSTNVQKCLEFVYLDVCDSVLDICAIGLDDFMGGFFEG